MNIETIFERQMILLGKKLMYPISARSVVDSTRGPQEASVPHAAVDELLCR